MEGHDAFRAIVDHVADGVVVVTNDGEVLYANPAAADLLGEGIDELVGGTFGYPLADGDRTEIDLLQPPGQRRIAEMRTSRIAWDGIDAYVASLRDITSRIATEQALREVVSTVSHEVRSPLAVVDGLIGVLLEGSEEDELGPQAREHLGTIGNQVERMDRLADDLLTFARLDAGELNVSAEEIDLTTILEDACREFGARGLEIEVEVDGDLTCWADPHHVRRIIDNFVSNAGKYGEPPYRIEGVREGDDVILRVTDEGPGVPRELQPRIFDRFSRGDEERASGTGLGLPIVLGLARTAGGDAWYEDDGEGATFAVRLPCPQD